jgi:hypothetical protein
MLISEDLRVAVDCLFSATSAVPGANGNNFSGSSMICRSGSGGRTVNLALRLCINR